MPSKLSRGRFCSRPINTRKRCRFHEWRDGERPLHGRRREAKGDRLRGEGVSFRNEITTAPAEGRVPRDDSSGTPIELFQLAAPLSPSW